MALLISFMLLPGAKSAGEAKGQVSSQRGPRLATSCGEGQAEACRRLLAGEPSEEVWQLAAKGPSSLVRNLADAAEQVGDRQRALAYLRLGAERFPRDATYHYALAQTILRNGIRSAPTYAEAYGPLLRAVQERPTFVEALVELATVQDHLGLPGEATQTYRRALTINPHSGSARIGLGQALLHLRRPREAASEFERLIAQATTSTSDRARASLGLGEALFWLGDGARALNVLSSIDSWGSGAGGCIDCLAAIISYWLGDLDRARRSCQTAVGGSQYCNCQGRRFERPGSAPWFDERDAKVLGTALTRVRDWPSLSESELVVEPVTAFNDTVWPKVADIRHDLHSLAQQYSDSNRVHEAIDDMLVRSRSSADVRLAEGENDTVHVLNRDEMASMLAGTTAGFDRRFPKAHGFITVSRPGFSKDGKVAALALQLNDDLCSGQVHLLLLDRVGQSWVGRLGGSTTW